MALSVFLLAAMLTAGPAGASDAPQLIPEPQILKWDKIPGLAVPVKYLTPAEAQEPVAAKLLKKFQRKFPGGRFHHEGYILQTGPDGAIVIAETEIGRIRAAQTLRQLSRAPAVTVADWPHDAWRGFHLMPYVARALPGSVKIVKDFLAPLKCNAFIFQIDYNYAFKSHPEVAEKEPFTRDQIKAFVAECRREGIEVIPLLNCLGHQSWKAEGIAQLLRAHPEFEEIPDARTPFADLNSERFYCRSWCPLHPDVNPLIFDLMDELIDAFDCKAFHVGMDETFVLASEKCPRCKGKDPAELFAKAVNDMHGHLSKRGQAMMIWGDRLLDSAEHDYGVWEASDMGTYRAIDMISKDVVICDWHYEDQKKYTSLETFTEKGFKVIPTIYRNPRAARQFNQEARKMRNPLILGPMGTVWCSALDFAYLLFPESDEVRIDPATGQPYPPDKLPRAQRRGAAAMAAVAQTLAWAWNPKSPPPDVFKPYAWGGPWAVPGRIEAEDFDPGKPGKAYRDTDRENTGWAYRAGGVDVDTCNDEGGGYCVTSIQAGEWTAYTLKTDRAGEYELDLRLSSRGGGEIEVQVNGKRAGDPVTVPAMKGRGVWETVSCGKIAVPAGTSTLKLVCRKPSYSLNYLVLR